MKLVCVSAYSSSAGAFKKGQIIEDSDAKCEFLLRDSPSSFEVEGAPKVKEALPEIEPETPDLSAMSTETATGVVAPDRRARGGGRR